MRSYQGLFLCLGLTVQSSQAWAFVQEEVPEPTAPSDGSAPANPPVSTQPAVPAPVAPKVPAAPVVTPGTKIPNAPGIPSGAKAPAKPGQVQTVPNSTSPKAPGVNPQGLPGAKGKITNSKLSPRKAKQKATAESLIKRRGATDVDSVIVGEAQVLPKNVFRFRYILRDIATEKGFDSAGKEFSAGASLTAKGHAFVLEYGLSDNWVVQLIAPYISSNELGINANEFKRSQAYEREYKKLVEAVTPGLLAKGLCTSAETCRTAIDNGLALGVGTPIELPSGESAFVNANVPIREAANSIILNAVKPSEGKVGVGDVQFGLGYNVYSSPRNVATVGLGIRLPTGEYTDVPNAYREPGSGFTSAGLRLLYDFRWSPVIFSLSHTLEYSLTKAKKSRSSILDPNYLNPGDPTVDDPEIPGAGDGVPNDGEIERKGIYHEGFTRVAYALGSLHRWMKPVAAYAYYGWIVDPEYHNLGHLYSKKYELYTASFAMSIDGLAMTPMFPMSFTYRREMAVGGRNVTLAPNSNFFQVNFYFKF